MKPIDGFWIFSEQNIKDIEICMTMEQIIVGT